ncbi:MAG: fatty acid desaturase [Polyangia bacterium]
MASPFRSSRQDARVLAAALLHGVLVAVLLVVAPRAVPAARAPWIAALAVSLVWASNTVAHIHLHTPLFRAPAANRALALYLTVLLGVPQTWWAQRHLRHHGLPLAPPRRAGAIVEVIVLAGFWAALGKLGPAAWLLVYSPAWALAAGLCALQGHYEHAAAGAAPAVDHYGRIYNWLWFNDGHHAQHHRAPSAHWSTLPAVEDGDARVCASPWPPLLRWMTGLTGAAAGLVPAALDLLERLPLGSPWWRRLVLDRHRRALAALLAGVDRGALRRVCIIGGALFPRTALLLRELLPDAALIVVDANPRHVAAARALLRDRGGDISYVTARFDPAAPPESTRHADLLVVPLAYRGARARFYAAPPAPLVLVHDWIWRRRGARGAIVSPWMLKRINLVGPAPPPPRHFDTLAEESPWQPPPLSSPPPSSAPPSSAFAPVTARRS